MIAPAAPVPAPGEEEARGLWNNDTHADSDSLLVVVPVTLAQQRAPARSTGKRRHLLDTDRTGSSTTSAASSSDSAHSLHSPYLYYPLILRHVELYDVLDSRSIHPMAATSLQPRKRATDDTRDKWVDGMPPIQNYFNPLLWHDDLSIPAKHSFALPRKAPVKSSIDAADVSTDEKGMVDENPVVMSFEFQFTPTSLMYYSLKRVVQTNMRIIRDLVGEESLDELRYWLSEDRMFMMLATQVVGWLHIIFEYLAFRDDYQFFKGRKSFRGISASSLVFQLFRSAILFLYLEDQGTSWLVLGGILKDLLYDGWKVFKILQPTIQFSRSLIPIKIRFQRHASNLMPARPSTNLGSSTVQTVQCDSEHPLVKCQEETVTVLDRPRNESQVENKLDNDHDATAEYDMIAVKHGWLCLFPLVLGLPVYYLKFYQYKSWYSWLVSSLVDFIYLFGFLSLTPQIYINYRLKSVAHLPMKSFMYKIFNTFIDDIFAFVVKMPLKHKIMTLRDDLIFIFFVYQWFIYRTDKSRANEFGFQYEEQDAGGDVVDHSEQEDRNVVDMKKEN